MNLYYELLKHPLFDMNTLMEYYSRVEGARSALKRLMKEGLVVKIRNNLYTCISGESMQPAASRFQIASSITPTSYVSHHSAMELYGLADQVYYEVYVSSETRFSDFDFGGYHYRYVPSKVSDGIEFSHLMGDIRITNLERTVIDCIRDMDRIAGLEETVSNISLAGRLSEKKLLQYLSDYDTQFLYQKTGFLLKGYQDALQISDDFFHICRDHIGHSRRYLTKDYVCRKYVKEWQLVVPENVFHLKNGEIVTDDFI